MKTTKKERIGKDNVFIIETKTSIYSVGLSFKSDRLAFIHVTAIKIYRSNRWHFIDSLMPERKYQGL